MRWFGGNLGGRGTACLLALSLSLAGCGGEVHFVSPQVAATPPVVAPPPTPPRVGLPHITERFHYQSASGTLVVPFVIYPSLYMPARLVDFLGKLQHFTRAFWDGDSDGFSEVRFVVAIDGEGSEPKVFSTRGLTKDQARVNSTAFLNAELDRVRDSFRTSLGIPRHCFYDTFQQVMSTVRQTPTPEDEPAWVHFFYFRDRDLPTDPASDSTYSSSQKAFASDFQIPPWSFARTSYSGFGKKTGRPLDIAEYFRLQFLTLPKAHFSELDPIGAEGLDWAARTILTESRKWILRRIPRPETVTVRIGKDRTELAREAVIFTSANEFTLSASAMAQLSAETEKEVEIEYEPTE